MPARKSPTRKRRTAPSTKRPVAAARPEPGPGEHPFFLDVPYEERAVAKVFGASWFTGLGYVYVGRSLPSELERYRPAAYSWEQWQEAEFTGAISDHHPVPAPTADTGSFTLRTDQLEDVRTILQARKAGAPQFLLGSDVGVGKTVTTIAAVNRMARVKNVLVVCPLPVAAGWRVHLNQMGDGGKNWCIINYESVKKLLTTPPSAQAAKKTRTKNLRIVREGTPKVQWDLVISDEAQHRSNPESQQSRALNRIIAGPGRRAAFDLAVSATAGANPAKISYLLRGLMWAQGAQAPQSVSIPMFLQWCQTQGFSVDTSGFNDALTWATDPGTEADAQLRRMNELIYGGETPWALRRLPNWPSVQRVPVPVELTAAELAAYNTEWKHFRAVQDAIDRDAAAGRTGAPRKIPPAAAATRGAAAKVRLRQKAGQIRAAGTAAFVAEKVSAGFQVAISAEYLGTVERIHDALAAKGIRVTTFTGANRDTRDEQRLAYQRGQYQVIIYTPTEGFNLQAGDTTVGGNNLPRLTVIAEPRWSPEKTLQAEGRAHRNGQNAPVYYTYAVGTVEYDVLTAELRGMRNTAMLNGDSTTALDALISKALHNYDPTA